MIDFNPDDFLNQQTEESMQDIFVPIPEGEYTAMVGDGQDDVKFDTFNAKDDPSRQFYRLTLWWIILDDNLKAQLNRQVLRVRDQFLVDVKDGKLATGPDTNVRLGARRTALGLNEPGQAFSLNMLRGKGPARIKVIHEPNPKEPREKFASVGRVVAL